MLGAAGVQIPEDNLDDLHSSKEMEHRKLWIPRIDWVPNCYDPLALVDSFTPVEDNIGLLVARFEILRVDLRDNSFNMINLEPSPLRTGGILPENA
ncbi:hypothetical protein Tco_0992364 [Tanacetum coccineum]|uniref:Uncharacterized protein n=1 Tax=Tanacetum coccineum TaxID=301880 RepID=A0ABQ5F244_9ASTR